MVQIETPPTEVLPELSVSREEARFRIEERIYKGKELKNSQIQDNAQLEDIRKKYYTWDEYNTDMLKRLFTTTELSDNYSKSYGFLVGVTGTPTLGSKIADLFDGIDNHIRRLYSILERIELYPVAGNTPPKTGIPIKNKTNKVFIVHGHDELAKTNLEVLLRELGLEPVILHRQADEGMTIIEKFEKHSDVGYAFILLTPDEISYLKTEENKKDQQRIKEKRARPNVIFEFGYFVGKLGRSKVCCLHTGDVSLPSDVSGMIYKKYLNSVEELTISIIKDLKASGYKFS